MKNLLLTDVDPKKIYMYKSRTAGSRPVFVLCDKTQGWLRGHVLVRGFANLQTRFSAVVTVKDVMTGEGRDMHVYRRAFSDPWYFDNNDYERVIVSSVDIKIEDLVQAQINKLDLENANLYAKIVANEAEIERLKEVEKSISMGR